MKKITIAIDGYSSCGKSTLAKSLAKELRYTYIDTGAMYRAVTLYFIRLKLPIDDNLIKEELKNITLSFKATKLSGDYVIHLNGENVENEIRLMEVANKVSSISKIKEIRIKMVALQQQLGIKKGIVMDGRDIGTVVFPDAEIKFFMTADTNIRAQRRYDELLAKGNKITIDEIKENIKSRDYQDTHRLESPLRKAHDAIEIDNSNINQSQQLTLALLEVKKKI